VETFDDQRLDLLYPEAGKMEDCELCCGVIVDDMLVSRIPRSLYCRLSRAVLWSSHCLVDAALFRESVELPSFNLSQEPRPRTKLGGAPIFVRFSGLFPRRARVEVTFGRHAGDPRPWI
jgi:hypothetical protein